MDFNHQFKLFKRASARYALNLALWLIQCLPYRVIRGVMYFFLLLWYTFALKLKRIAHESLVTAFGSELSSAQRRKVVRQCFEKVGRSMTDLIYYAHYPEGVTQRFHIEGRSHLDRALEKGRGAIMVTAHFGNFCLMMLDLAQRGYKVNCIIRRAHDTDVAATIFESMNRVRVRPIYSSPPRKSVQESLQALRNNEILFVLLDQHFGSGNGVFVDFFGRKAATATGPAVLARRTQAPILPVFTIRNGEDYRMVIEPSLDLEPGDDQAAVTADVAKITRIIEGYIRQYPTEWGWMHRRWKK